MISSDGGLLLHRELEGDALGLTDLAASTSLADPRIGKNGRHHLAGLLRQSVFSRLAGYRGPSTTLIGCAATRCLSNKLSPISCGVSDFRGAGFGFGVEPDGSGGLPVADFA